ncbi:MAG: hypothetical protein M1812_006215 [Candelaria pacifica]|nr:MAG: hypothetical protein M1812_006215 [Candelaria pacifica]
MTTSLSSHPGTDLPHSQTMASPTPIHLLGTTLEGGGQLLRIALSLSSLTHLPLQITHIRGGRPSSGLKTQHLTCVNWLGLACNATLEGAEKKSRTLLFKPSTEPTNPKHWWKTRSLAGGRKIRECIIDIGSPGSIGLVLQAVLPFILFSSPTSFEGSTASEMDNTTPINLTIKGGTNVSFSPSYDYISQVLLPTLERIGLPPITISLDRRGWSHGRTTIGSVTFTITPLPPKTHLPAFTLTQRGEIDSINVTMLVPPSARNQMHKEISKTLNTTFPNIPIKFLVDEDSRDKKRFYLLLTAHTHNNHTLGRDWLFPQKTTDISSVVTTLVSKVVNELLSEIKHGGCVDEYMQDQLIIYQALAKGKSIIDSGGRIKKGDIEDQDNGCESREASLHTQTARWVANQVLGVIFDEEGGCEGVGYVVGERFGGREVIPTEELESGVADLKI